MFLGRERELEVLSELHASSRPELFVLYGRRRVGKTELLQRLCAGRRAVYFQAAQVRERDNLRAFRDALAERLGDEIAARVELPDWEAALEFALERSAPERLLVVLDEFPYLCDANRGLPSILQRFWDRRGKTSSLMLVLCGSQVSFMEREVLAERSPLFGRRTGQKRLEPLRPPDALGFFPGWGPSPPSTRSSSSPSGRPRTGCSRTRCSAGCPPTCAASTRRARCARTCCARSCGRRATSSTRCSSSCTTS